MALTMIDAPPLGVVAKGVAGLWSIEAQGFSSDGNLLLVKAVYSDQAYLSVPMRTAVWIYDVLHGQYSACVNDLITTDRSIEVSDVAISRFGGQVQLIAAYHDTVSTGGLDFNKLALIRNGILIQSDLVHYVTGVEANAVISAVKVTANGRFVVMETASSNLATGTLDTNGCKDIYVLDLVLNSSRLISTVNGAESGFDSLLGDVLVGADGGLSVAFQSAQAFAAQDTNATDDVYVWHLSNSDFGTATAGTVELVSRGAVGAVGGARPILDLTGTLFESASAALSALDVNNAVDVWQAGDAAIVPVSISASGTLSQQTTLGGSSDGGRYVALVTASPELAGQVGVDQLVVLDTLARSSVIVSKSVAGVLADDAVMAPVLSADGTRIAFSSQASNLGTGSIDGQMHLYVSQLQVAPDSTEVVNNGPTGTIVIAGSVTQGQSLSANASSLADADGLGPLSYQWLRANNVIVGATSSTYTLGQTDVGSSMSVRISYIDASGKVESLSSAATAAVVNINDPPAGSVTVSGQAIQGWTLAANASTLSDVDGLGSLSYQWLRAGNVVAGATGNTYFLSQGDVSSVVSVRISYTDGGGNVESVSSTNTSVVANINDSPTGSVTISGDPTVGGSLHASNSIADLDGVGPISYQWLVNGITISGATGSSYVLTSGDVGKTFTVLARYVDGFGTSEYKASSPTAAVGLIDTTAPTVAFTDNISGIANLATASVTYSLTFSEAVSGLDATDFTVTNGTVNSVSGSGSTWIVNVSPALNVTSGAIGLTLKAGAVSDAAGNLNAAASNAEQTLDTSSPIVAIFSPTDEAKGVAIGDNITLTFGEAVQRGAGNIVLKTTAGATVATYDAASSANLTVTGNTLTINPSSDLVIFTGYQVELAAGTIKDLAGNSYAGTTSYSFTTLANPANQYIVGTASNDTLTGGAGIDTAVFSGSSTEYWVTYDALSSTYSVKDAVSSRDGTDKLTSVELLQFSDGVRQLATTNSLLVDRVYQSLFGKAPSSATLNDSLARLGLNGTAFDWAKAEALGLSALSDSAFSTLVLNNMSITNKSLIATPAFGTSQQVYDALQQALTDYLTWVGNANRGIVVAQMAQIMAGFEGETTFGVYGAAATAFNRQVSSDLAHSINTQNTNDVVAVPVFTAATVSASGSDFEYMLAMGSYAYQIGEFGTGDRIIGPTGVSGTLVNGSPTDGVASIQYVSGGQTVSVTLTGLTTPQDSALHGTADLNTLFGIGTLI